ncbi:MAG: transglycosylase domain-containing protein, partial [Hyphomicrobiaceae bacterium]
RKVHHMASIVLASLTGKGTKPVRMPTLISRLNEANFSEDTDDPDRSIPGEAIVPNRLIKRAAVRRVRDFLSAPLCYEFRKKRIGTLKSLAKWCAKRRREVKLHFAKTGTQVTEDPDATVDAWVAGGIQFRNGPAYSYVVVVGTGNNNEPWARRLHAAQLAAPLVAVLLEDLAADAKGKPQIVQRASVAVTSGKKVE